MLDLGCGPGAQTMALAGALPGATILAVDVLEAMVDETNDRIAAADLGQRVNSVVGDMARPPVDPDSQDLIWCEGAIYFMGVTDALRSWRPLLSDRGHVAFTEPIWLTSDPPAEVEQWWRAEYPAISGDEGVRSRVEAGGFRTIDSFPLPATAWSDEYYEPMQDRIDALRNRLPDDAAAVEVVAAAGQEIDMHRRFSDRYSYGFYVVGPDD